MDPALANHRLSWKWLPLWFSKPAASPTIYYDSPGTNSCLWHGTPAHGDSWRTGSDLITLYSYFVLSLSAHPIPIFFFKLKFHFYLSFTKVQFIIFVRTFLCMVIFLDLHFGNKSGCSACILENDVISIWKRKKMCTMVDLKSWIKFFRNCLFPDGFTQSVYHSLILITTYLSRLSCLILTDFITFYYRKASHCSSWH